MDPGTTGDEIDPTGDRVAGRAGAGRAASRVAVVALVVQAAVGDRVAGAPADPGEARPATGGQAAGRPTGEAAPGSDFAAATGRSATSATGIEAAVARRVAVLAPGTAKTGRCRADGRGTPAGDARPTVASTAHGVSRVLASTTARGDSRVGRHAAGSIEASIADPARARIVVSTVPDRRDPVDPRAGGREPHSVPAPATTAADRQVATRPAEASSEAERHRTAGRRLARFPGPTGPGPGRTDRGSRPGESRART